jgi:phosphoglycolate phosphatase
MSSVASALPLRWQCVIFDLDGTLLDTRDALLHAINTLLERLQRRPVRTAELSDATHEGIESMVIRALQLTGSLPDAATQAAMHAEVSTGYLATAAARIKPFPAAAQLLEALLERDVWMAVCTNQLELHARELLKAFGLSRYFREVVGRDTFAFRKPNPLPLIWLLGRCGVHPSQALMVGDSELDAHCAAAAGTAVVLMRHGYGSAAAIENHPGCTDFIALRDLIRGSRPIEKIHTNIQNTDGR